MSQYPAFVVPDGVLFRVADAEVEVENKGDVVLHAAFEQPLRVRSTHGSVHVHAPLGGGTVHAAGDVTVHGDVRASEIHAGGDVRVHGRLEADRVVAGGVLHAAGSLQVTRITAAAVAANGDVSTQNLDISGTVHAGGTLTAGRVRAASMTASSARVGDVSVGGHVRVDAALVADSVRAGGDVSVSGPVQVGLIRGRNVSLTGASVQVRGVQATEAAHFGGGKLAADVVVAPRVRLDAGVSGRVTVLEAAEELAPNALKGCFTMEDYRETFGADPVAYLRERGVSPPGVELPEVDAPVGALADPGPFAAPPELSDDASGPPGVDALPADAAPAEAGPTEALVEEDAAAAEPSFDPAEIEEVVASNAHHDDDEARAADLDEVPMVEAEPIVEEPPKRPSIVVKGSNLAPPPDADWASASMPGTGMPRSAPDADADGEPPTPRPSHPSHTALVDAVRRISDCYVDTEAPPAVTQLEALVHAGDYERVRADVASIWSDVVKFHQRSGLRIQHQVTTTFNQINVLVKQM